ncbi:MAG: hypothetical protein HXS54_06250 [Theionarchaea archaeon]|nr:hypothetical protein [Theionarchaea archaeon]DBA34860.1 TPA_asm: hypothetical protein vir521_00066 [Caudoviricetes sp. vir521]
MQIETDGKTALLMSKKAFIEVFKDEIANDPDFIAKSVNQIEKYAVTLFIAIQDWHEENKKNKEQKDVKPSTGVAEVKKVLQRREDDSNSKKVEIPPVEMLEELLEEDSENNFYLGLQDWYERTGFFTEDQITSIEKHYLRRKKTKSE